MLKAAECDQEIGGSSKLVMERIRQFQRCSGGIRVSTGSGGSSPAAGNLR